MLLTDTFTQGLLSQGILGNVASSLFHSQAETRQVFIARNLENNDEEWSRTYNSEWLHLCSYHTKCWEIWGSVSKSTNAWTTLWLVTDLLDLLSHSHSYIWNNMIKWKLFVTSEPQKITTGLVGWMAMSVGWSTTVSTPHWIISITIRTMKDNHGSQVINPNDLTA